MEIDESSWQFFPKPDERVRHIASEALAKIGWDAVISNTRQGKKLGNGPVNANCIEILCVKIEGVPEVCHCIAADDSLDVIVDRFAASFKEHSGL